VFYQRALIFFICCGLLISSKFDLVCITDDNSESAAELLAQEELSRAVGYRLKPSRLTDSDFRTVRYRETDKQFDALGYVQLIVGQSNQLLITPHDPTRLALWRVGTSGLFSGYFTLSETLIDIPELFVYKQLTIFDEDG
jgi:hypothetical protein